MRIMTLGFGLVFAASLGETPAWAQLQAFELGPSEAVYPPRNVPLRFSHRQHLDSGNVNCSPCHTATIGPSSDEDIEPSLRADHESCSGCHSDWLKGPLEGCRQCHEGVRAVGSSTVVAAVERPEPNLVFSHQGHDRKSITCLDCHAQIPRQGRAGSARFPTMDRCLACHQERRAPSECGTCHPQDRRGKLIQEFDSGLLVPRRFSPAAAHIAGFELQHGAAATRERVLCQACHDDAECLFCHDGIGRDARYHPDPWILQHGLRGASDRSRCQGCHRVQTFCLTCHQRSGIAVFGPLENPLMRPSVRRVRPSERTSPAVGPHPMAADGWLDPGSPRSHGRVARRQIHSCASCHQEQFCILCHGSGFQGQNGPNPAVSPHGPNPERLRSLPAARQTARACLKCHSPLDIRWRPTGSGR